MVFKKQESRGEIYLAAGAEEVLARPVAEKTERVDRAMGHNFEEEPTGGCEQGGRLLYPCVYKAVPCNLNHLGNAIPEVCMR